MRPASCPLPINIHGNSQQANPNSNSAHDKEDIPHPLQRHPGIQIIRQPEGEQVFDKVHDCKAFAGFVTMAVYHVGYNTRGSELDSEVDEPKANYHRDRPWVLSKGGLAPSKKSGGGKEEVGNHDGETEFGLWG